MGTMPESSSQDTEHTVVVLTRVGCPACEQAERDVERICGELGVRWSTTHGDTHPELRAEYGARGPLIRVDGAEHRYWSVDEQRLRSALGA